MHQDNDDIQQNGISSKQDDALFMNSVDIENIERYLNIRDDFDGPRKKSNRLDGSRDEAEISLTPYYLPLKEIHREKSQFREKLENSINLFSRIMSPEAERLVQNLKVHLDNPSIEAYLSNQFDEDEIVDYLLDEPTQEKEEAFLAEIEKMLKNLENYAPSAQDVNCAFLMEGQLDENESKEINIMPLDVKESADFIEEKVDNNSIKSNQNNLIGIHHKEFFLNEFPPNAGNNTIRTTIASDRNEPEPEPQPNIIETKNILNQKKKKGCQIF